MIILIKTFPVKIFLFVLSSFHKCEPGIRQAASPNQEKVLRGKTGNMVLQGFAPAQPYFVPHSVKDMIYFITLWTYPDQEAFVFTVLLPTQVINAYSVGDEGAAGRVLKPVI